jgi:hypothetical protein
VRRVVGRHVVRRVVDSLFGSFFFIACPLLGSTAGPQYGVPAIVSARLGRRTQRAQELSTMVIVHIVRIVYIVRIVHIAMFDRFARRTNGGCRPLASFLLPPRCCCDPLDAPQHQTGNRSWLVRLSETDGPAVFPSNAPSPAVAGRDRQPRRPVGWLAFGQSDVHPVGGGGACPARCISRQRCGQREVHCQRVPAC